MIVPWSHTPPPLFTRERIASDPEPLITEHELDEFVDLVLEDQQLTERLEILTAWRHAGLKTVEDVLNQGGEIIEHWREAKKVKCDYVAGKSLLSRPTMRLWAKVGSQYQALQRWRR